MKNKFIVIVIILIATGTFVGYKAGNKSTSSTTNKDTTNTSVTKTTEAAKTTPGGSTIDQSNKGLTKVTSDIYGKTNTVVLILSNNSLKTLPSEMGKMTKVTNFKIDHNILEGSLIGEIRQMSQLTNLDVSYNNMTGMPAEIGQLSKLVTLNYSYNKIDGLPNELANLKNNLKEFNLTGNPLSQDTINKLKASLPNTNIIF
ncbi:MAG: hypothetical protein WCJ60_03530 [bacterium]